MTSSPDVPAAGLPERRILDALDVGVAILGVDGSVLYANAAVRTLLGVVSDGFVGAPFEAAECWPTDAIAQSVRAAFHGANSGQRVQEDLELGGAAQRVVQATFRPLGAEVAVGGRVVVSIVDVTERGLRVSALERREAVTRRMIDAVPEGVLEVAADGRIGYANEAARRLLRLPRGSRLTAGVADLATLVVQEGGTPLPSDEFPPIRCLASGDAQPPVTLGVRHPDGGLRWAVFAALPVRDDSTGELSSALVTFLDITDRVVTEQALERSEQRLAYAQRVAHIGHWDWNVATDTLEWSDEIHRIFGRGPGEFEATYASFLQCVHPEDRESVALAVDHALKSRIPYKIDHRIVRPDGEVRIVHEAGEISRGEAGEPLRVLGTVQDVTERKATEEELRRSLEEKNVLLREVHHRVKNNLQVVSSLLYLQGRSTDVATSAMLDESRRRIRVMALIHESLYQSGDVGNIPLREYIGRLVGAIVGSFKGVMGRVQVLTEVDDFYLDIERATPCGLIVNELVTNSLKYAFEGRESGVIRVGFHRVGDVCTMEIGDDGKGLPPSAGLDSTTATLGLRLVRTLAEQLSATVETRRHPGTTFVFAFPCGAS